MVTHCPNRFVISFSSCYSFHLNILLFFIAPEPPSNLAVRVRKVAQVTWDPPAVGGVTGYKIKVCKFRRKYCLSINLLNHLFSLQLHALSEPSTSVRTFVLSEDASPFTLRDLTPGASYRLELHSIFENRDSDVPAVQNFTTSNQFGSASFHLRYVNENYLIFRTQYTGKIYRLVQERDYPFGLVAASVSCWNLF